MRPSRSRAFTLVELLVVIAIIAVLIALMVPTAQAVRTSMRTSNCQSNLHNIGEAVHQAMATTGGKCKFTPADWTTALLPYLQNQESVMRCSELDAATAVGYGINNLANAFGQGDSRKVFILDYANKVAEIIGPDIADVDRAKRWDTQKAPRHAGLMNVLYFDAHVSSRDEAEIDPVSKELHDYWWMPTIRKPWDLKLADENAGYEPGLVGEYRRNLNFDGAAEVVRVDTDLNYPFGGGNLAKLGDQSKHPFWTASMGSKYFQDPHTAILRGQIKAENSENYIFRVSSDDGFTITIDGKQVISYNDWTGDPKSSGSSRVSEPFPMLGGKWSEFELRFYNDRAVGIHLWVKWSSPSVPEQSIPSANFRHKTQ